MTRRGRARSAAALGMDMWMLGLEAATVIGLRTLKLAAGGPAAQRESRKMVAEKLRAAVELPGVLAGSSSPEAAAKAAVRHYSKKVRANRKRLSGSAGA